MFLNALHSWLNPKKKSPIRKPAKRPSLRIESLEERAVPATLTVGAGHQYQTITAALAAAPANATIDVYPGTYHETVAVTKSGISLVAEGTGVIIQPTAATPVTLSGTSVGGAAVDIYASNVVVNGFTVDGSQDTTGNLWAGIRVIEGGSATIKNNTVEGMINGNPVSDIGIQVGTSLVSSTKGGAGTAKVNNNTIVNYAGAGVLVDGSGASATIQNDTITGRGIGNGGISEYGVQVSNLATARVQSNTISGNTTTGPVVGGDNPFPASAGIFFFNDGNENSVAALNSITGNDDGVLVQASNGTNKGAITVVNNDVHGNFGFAGILVLTSNNVDVVANDVSGNTTFNGIALTSSSGVLVGSNDVYNNANGDGIYDFEGSSNQILANNSYTNGNNGINIDTTTGDQVFNNFTWSNAFNGIQVTGGSNNALWVGVSSINDEDGILLVNTTGNTVVGNVLASNAGWGLHLENAQNTLVALNLITGNDTGSILIDSQSAGTQLIANWTSTPPVKEGTSGASGSSSWFVNSCAAADADVSGLCD